MGGRSCGPSAADARRVFAVPTRYRLGADLRWRPLFRTSAASRTEALPSANLLLELDPNRIKVEGQKSFSS